MKSMTAYAERSDQRPEGSLHWIIRSVNHRYLDCQIRLPEDFRHLETQLRQILKSRLARGKVEANLHFNPDSGQIAQAMTINPQVAQGLSELIRGLEQHVGEGQADLSHLLHWPGLVDHEQLDLSAVYEQAVAMFDGLLDDFIDARRQEGKAIGDVLIERLDAIEQELAAVRAHAPQIREALEGRLRTKLETLRVDVDPGRMEQEVALMLQKTDVDEELDRLAVHVTEVRRILTLDEPMGRRLDFLVQEMNREANTLGSKASLVETSQSSIELKVLIEQLREQIQNIE